MGTCHQREDRRPALQAHLLGNAGFYARRSGVRMETSQRQRGIPRERPCVRFVPVLSVESPVCGYRGEAKSREFVGFCGMS